MEGPPAAGIGIVIDHDDLCTTKAELLHGAQADALEAADDDVTLHVVGAPAIHKQLSVRFVVEVAAALNVCVLLFVGSNPRGAVAQWSEQGTHDPWVMGSIPTSPTKLGYSDFNGVPHLI